MALWRDDFPMVLKISGVGSFYFMHVKETQVLCGNVKRRHCATSSLLFREGLRYLLSGGQSSGCPWGRTVTALGRKH